MAKQWVIGIEYGDFKANVTLIHQYPDGRHEPWSSAFANRNNVLPKTGHWDHGQRDASSGEVRMYDVNNNKLLSLHSFKNLKVGLIGRGFFFAEGYAIPEGADIFWEVHGIH